METFPIIYKAQGTNKVIIQNGLYKEFGRYSQINCEVSEIKKVDTETFIIKHIPIEEIIKEGGKTTNTPLSSGTILFLCLKIDSGTGTIRCYYCNEDGTIITSSDKLNTLYGKFRTNPFYFKTNDHIFPSGEEGVSKSDFYNFLFESKQIVLETEELKFDSFFLTENLSGGARKIRKRRQSRKKYAFKKSKKYCRSRKRKGSRKRKSSIKKRN